MPTARERSSGAKPLSNRAAGFALDSGSALAPSPGLAAAPIPAGDSLATETLAAFREKVCQQGRLRYRELPWRHIEDPYGVLVSEVMLQQTQVARVLGRWERWMRLFPTVDALAAADTALVLEQWQGLGYNRRALALHRAAKECSSKWGGRLPRDLDDLLALPGIGPATAAGVRAFAYDLPGVYLETNVRTVFLHELFAGREGIADAEIIPLVKAACPQTGVRDWYYALLDYGAYLKSQLPNPSRRSKHHARQSKFEGSHRQKRAEALRIVLAAEQIALPELEAALNRFEAAHGRGPVEPELPARLAAELSAEGFFFFDPATGLCLTRQ